MEETIKIKPIVQYLPSNFNFIQKGKRAMVIPVDHPSSLVSNSQMVLTSLVIEVGDTWFETENTRYMLQDTYSCYSSPL